MSFWKKFKNIITYSPLKKLMEWLNPIPEGPSRGLDISRQGSDNALPVIYGVRRVGAVVVHKYVTGDENEFLHYIAAYNHGPITSVDTVYFNGVRSGDPQWGGSGSVQTRRGTATQTANSGAVANIPNWNNDARGRNVCYGWHRFTQFKETQVWRGEPEVTADIRGMEVYDWRTDTTGFSDNPAVCAVDYLTNPVYGRGLSWDQLNLPEWTAAADFCDEPTESQVERTVCTAEYNPPDYRPTQNCTTETVTISEPRYRLNAIIDTGNTVFDNYRKILRSFRASPNRTNGLVGVSIETVGDPVVTFDEDDLVGSVSYSSTGSNDRYNRVIVRFQNAETDFQGDEISYPDSSTAGQALHQEWLEEDNGKELVGEFEFDTFTSKSDAAQMAEIIAKRSRINRVVSFRARRLARLVVPNDIVGLTDEAFGWVNKPVRVESRREVEPGVFEFEAVDHENAVYPWSGSSWSQQVGGTVLGNPTLVAAPTNLQITNDETLATTGTLNWQIVADAFIRRFDVTLTQNGAEIYDREEIGQSHTIPRLDAGSYVLTVRAVSTINRLSDPASIAFTLTQPVAPSQLNLSASNNTVTSEPFLAGAGLGTTFEFDLSDDPTHTPEGRIRARTATFSGLLPNTEHTVWVRTLNALGASAWVSDTIETTADAAEIEQVLENSPTVIDFGDRITESLDRVGTNERLLDDLEFDVQLDRKDRTGSDAALLTAMADRTAAQWELRRRQKDDKRLINAVVDVDPDTGVIRNKAFSYTNEQFNQAEVLIDGVAGSVTIQAERITLVEGEVENLNSEIQVLPGVIDARATAIVTDAISALEPAYAFNFFDSTQDWVAVNGTLTAGNSMVSATWGDIENSQLVYDAQENPALRIVLERTAGTGWTGDLEVEFDDQTIQTFAGAIEPVETTEQRVVRIVNLQGEEAFAGSVVRVRLVLGASVDDTFEIDSITIGKPDAVTQDIANIQAQVNEASLRIDATEAAIGLRVTQTTYDNNTVTFSNFSQTLDAAEGYIELRGQYQQIIDDDVITKANDASIVIDGFEGTITQLAQTVEDNQEDNSQTFTQVQTELNSVTGTIRNQAFSIARNTEGVDTSLADNLIGEADYILFKWGQLDRNKDFAFAVQELRAETGPDGSLAQNILQLEANFNGLDGNFSAFVDQTETAFADQEQALAQTRTDLRAEIEDASEGAENNAVSTATDVLNARIGYCVDSEGNPTGADDRDACLLTSGNEWITGAPLAETIRATRIETADGEFASFSQIGQTYEDVDGNLVARGAMLTDVNGRVSGFVNVNTGDVSTMDVIADSFRWGVDDGSGGFNPLLALEDVNGSPTATFRGRVVLDGTALESASDVQDIDGARFATARYSFVSGFSTTITDRWLDLVGRAPKVGDQIQQTAPTTGPATATSIRRWTGTSWDSSNPSLVVNGELVAFGEIQGPSFTAIGGGERVQIDPSAPNDVVLWSGNSSVTPANRTRANADFFIDVDGEYPRTRVSHRNDSATLSGPDGSTSFSASIRGQGAGSKTIIRAVASFDPSAAFASGSTITATIYSGTSPGGFVLAESRATYFLGGFSIIRGNIFVEAVINVSEPEFGFTRRYNVQYQIDNGDSSDSVSIQSSLTLENVPP